MLGLVCIGTYLLLLILRARDDKEWAQITERLWRQEMREKYPSPPYPPL